jgi:hypothetical protein
MTPGLKPVEVLDRLAHFHGDEVRGVVVLDRNGRCLAGSPAVAAPAAELVGAAGAPEVEVGAERGLVFAVRGRRHALAAVCTRAVLPALIRYDLRAVLAELEATV